MPTLDERVSFLEGRLAEQSTILQNIQQAIASLDGRVRQDVSSLDGRTQQSLAGLDQRMQQGFADVDRRMQQGFADVDQRMQQGFVEGDQRIRDLDTKMSSQFHWLVGLFIGTFLTTTIGFVGIVMTLLKR